MYKSTERHLAYRREYYRKNIESMREAARRYGANNKEIKNLKQRIYASKNPEKIKALQRRYYSLNKATLRVKHLEWKELLQDAGKYGDLQRKWTLRKRYGMTREDYDSLMAKQDGVCAICKDSSYKKTLHVDHDHITGRVRALLCHKCNVGIALFGDSLMLLQAAKDYLIIKHFENEEEFIKHTTT